MRGSRHFLAAALALANPLAGVTVLTIAAAPALARDNQNHECGADFYRNSRGVCVHRPEHSSSVPRGATAQCRDGTYSFSQSRRGTCSHHGGVARWL
jgi:hypothetical protein